MGSGRIRAWWEGSVRPALELPTARPAIEPVRRSHRVLDPTIDAKIGDCAVYRGGQREGGRLPLERAAQTARQTDDGFVWIGLQQPTAEEVAQVADEFDLPPLAVEDAITAHQRPKLEVYGDVVFVVLKPVDYIDHEEIVEVSEMALFVGPTFVVTVRHGESTVLGRVRAELDDGFGTLACNPSTVLYRAADLVVDGYEEVIELVDDDVDEIEAQVFGSGEADHSERIYKLKREIAEFRRSVVPLAPALERLAKGAVPGIDPALAHSFRDVHDHLMRAGDAIEGHDRLLTDVLQANLARVAVRQAEVAVRQNEDMRKISAWAAIALLPTAVAGVYGMNFDHMPELRWRYGYFVVLTAIAVACAALYRQFRKRGWL
ncbi:MAG TPA: magnesium and cobalt transport protein CorA [Iamia sp.]|nr:magnesium and cobalt transport protein CorA [Iamia sp.]